MPIPYFRARHVAYGCSSLAVVVAPCHIFVPCDASQVLAGLSVGCFFLALVFCCIPAKGPSRLGAIAWGMFGLFANLLLAH